MKKWFLAIILTCLAIALMLVLVFPEQTKTLKVSQNGTVKMLEFGKAGNYGYLTFYYNGSGNVSLLALSEQPKNNIILLKKDYLNTERYSYFFDELKKLWNKNFIIKEVDEIGDPQNSIIIIPSGAMPLDVLLKLDNLTVSNQIIYIGKIDLVHSTNLLRTEWYKNISNRSKLHIMVFEKTLSEFYSEKNNSIFDAIETNSWAVKNSTNYIYSGEGNKTIFINLSNASWMRMLPLSDSQKLSNYSAEIHGPEDIFPWQNAQYIVQFNYSTGIAQFAVEKDGVVLNSNELARVRGKEAFFFTLNPLSSGDYLLRISDQAQTLGAKKLHVKNLSVSLARVYGNNYEFEVFIDGAPLENASALIGLNHSNNKIETEVKNGKLNVRANLRQGENAFVISLFGQKNIVFYNNNQESLIEFYAKTLIPGIAIVALFYVWAYLNKKPVYRIRVPEGVVGKNHEITVTQSQIVSIIENIEKRFGWKRIPLSIREIGFGLKYLTEGLEVNEGNVEAIMKKLEEKNVVKSYFGFYELAEWGDPKFNALRRIVRDKLIQNGIEFTEIPNGFEYEGKQIIFNLEKAKGEVMVVFERSEEIRTYLSSLEEKTRAQIEIKIKNGILRLVTLDELDELIS